MRDYGTAKWQGGDPECDHKQYLGGHNPEVSPKQLSSQGTQQYNYRNKCGKCGAVRIDAQIGLELTPDEYIANLVAVFRECKRILRDDGTLFVNMGDSYFSGGQRATSYDICDKELAGFQDGDLILKSLCGECRKDYQSHISRNDSPLVAMLATSTLSSIHAHKGFEHDHFPTSDSFRQANQIEVSSQDYFALDQPSFVEQLHAFLVSKIGVSSPQLLDEWMQRGNSFLCLSCGRSLVGCDLESAHKLRHDLQEQSQHIQDSALHGDQQASRNQCRDKDGECYSDIGSYPYYTTTSLKPKDLIGIPWMLAFALRADGWYLRQDIIWCLSGGAFVYVKTQKGVMPMMVKDMARLDPSTVKLWNGDKWTRLLGVSKSERKGDELEIVLRSGERISCTPSHKFPTARGLLTASELTAGDILRSTTLPDVDNPRDCVLDEDAAWFAGLYIAEGSRQHGCIQIAGHSKEIERWERCNHIAKKFGGYVTLTVDGNNQAIRMYGKVLNAILDELVSGTYASDKCFATVTWRYSNKFIASMLDGYLSGDGHWEAENNRWRLGFTRNYNLERDLRTACARLGYRLILNMSTVPYKGKDVPTFRGELRKERSTHHNNKNANEVMEIRKARCRYVYDLGVADEPHLFALASGILTHNSKPNPMPESVKDRCTKSHEYIFLLSKSAKYYYDSEAIVEPANADVGKPRAFAKKGNGDRNDTGNMYVPKYYKNLQPDGQQPNTMHLNRLEGNEYMSPVRNKRDVWFVSTKPYKGAHYATFNPELIKPCILAGAPEGGIVFDPFVGSGTTVATAMQLGRKGIGLDLSMKYLQENAKERIDSAKLPLFEI